MTLAFAAVGVLLPSVALAASNGPAVAMTPAQALVRVSFSTVVAGRSGPAQTRREPAGSHPAPNVVTVRPQPVAQAAAPTPGPRPNDH